MRCTGVAGAASTFRAGWQALNLRAASGAARRGAGLVAAGYAVARCKPAFDPPGTFCRRRKDKRQCGADDFCRGCLVEQPAVTGVVMTAEKTVRLVMGMLVVTVPVIVTVTVNMVLMFGERRAHDVLDAVQQAQCLRQQQGQRQQRGLHRGQRPAEWSGQKGLVHRSVWAASV